MNASPSTKPAPCQRCFRIGAVFGFLGVALGAFGAHLLNDKLAASGHADVWETAVFYHLIHAVIATATAHWGASKTSALFLIGILFFSGSLYALAFFDISKFGFITPIGGAFFLAGWIGLLLFKPSRHA